VLPQPPRKRGAFVNQVEGGKWLVSLHTRFEKDLPTNHEEMLAFAEEIEVPEVAEFLKKAVIAGPVHTYRKPEANWRRYDKLEWFPEGLLVRRRHDDPSTDGACPWGWLQASAWTMSSSAGRTAAADWTDWRRLFPEAIALAGSVEREHARGCRLRRGHR
jgi:hypothetical protein